MPSIFQQNIAIQIEKFTNKLMKIIMYLKVNQ